MSHSESAVRVEDVIVAVETERTETTDPAAHQASPSSQVAQSKPAPAPCTGGVAEQPDEVHDATDRHRWSGKRIAELAPDDITEILGILEARDLADDILSRVLAGRMTALCREDDGGRVIDGETRELE